MTFITRPHGYGELTALLRRLRDRIAHIQVADNPGRNEPGTGEINYRFMFDMLDREGYAGWIKQREYRPAAGTSAGSLAGPPPILVANDTD